MEGRLQTLKKVAAERGREIVVSPNGTVRALVRREERVPSVPVPESRVTKLAPRVFGRA